MTDRSPSLVAGSLRRARLIALSMALSMALTGVVPAAIAGDAPAPVPPMGAADARLIVLNGMDFQPGVDPSPSFSPELEGWRDADNPYFLVRFDGPVGQPQIAALEGAGARVLDSLSYYTQLVRIDPEHADSLRGLAKVLWVGPWTAGMKSAPKLMVAARDYEAEPGVEQHFLIYPQRDRSATELLPELQALTSGVAGIHWMVNDATVDGTGTLRVSFSRPEVVAATLITLARQLAVFSIHPWSPAYPTNSWNRVFVQGGIPPYLFQQTPTVAYTGVPWTSMPEPGEAPQSGDTESAIYPIHARGLLGRGECVALMDTGLQKLDYFEPFRACSILSGCNSSNWDTKVVCHHRIASTGPCSDEGDSCSFHGTHTSGTVAGDLNLHPDGGYDFGDGMAPQAKLIMQDAASIDSYGRCPFSGIDLAALRDTRISGTDSGGFSWQCRIHSDSWGSGNGGYSGDSILFDEAVWDSSTSAGLQQDWLPLTSAGNSGPEPHTLGKPASAKNIITVGASDGGLAGAVDTLSFSSVGPTDDGTGRLKPDVVSTGCALSTCGDDEEDSCTGFDGFVAGRGLSYKCGTSMAAPTVAGAAALSRQYLREGWYPCGHKSCAGAEYTAPSAALLKAMIINGTRVPEGAHYGNSQPVWGDPVPNNKAGFGWVNLENSLYFEGDRLQVKILADKASTSGGFGFGLKTGETQHFTLPVSGAEPLRLTLVWTDPQGNSVGDALVNDLNLELTAPDGTTYRGNSWSLDFLGQLYWPSKPNSATPDNVNNVEAIYLPEPQPGSWTVDVVGANVPGRSGVCDAPCTQGYALVASGRFFSEAATAGDGYLLASEYGISGGCDDDAYLDNGERATLEIKVKNFGSSDADSGSVTPSVASDSTLPATYVSISPATYSLGSVAVGAEASAIFHVRYLEHPDNLSGEYLKLQVDYEWDQAQGEAAESLSIPLMIDSPPAPFYGEDFESTTPGESPAGWTSEEGGWTCGVDSCEAGTFSGFQPGPPPQVVSCDEGSPRPTEGQELKFGANDCATVMPCCRLEQSAGPDLFLLLNQMTELSYYLASDSPSWGTWLKIDPDGSAGPNFAPYKAQMSESSSGNEPWSLYRADLRALQKIRGTYFNLQFINASGPHPLATEQGSLVDDISIASFDYDPANGDSGPPVLVAPAQGAVDVSVRPELSWEQVSDHGDRNYSARVCTDSSCNDVVWSESGLTENQVTVGPSLRSLTLHYWQTMVEDNCAIGEWGSPWSFTTAQADFDLSVPTEIIRMQRHSSEVRTVTVDWLNGYDGDVTLSCENLPADTNCSFSPNPLLWVDGITSAPSDMTLTAGDTATGRYTFRVVATGTIDGSSQAKYRNRTLVIEGEAPGQLLGLDVERSGAELQFNWLASPCDAQEYALYVGELDEMASGSYNHDIHITCSTGGALDYALSMETYLSHDFEADLEGWHPVSMGCPTNHWKRSDQCSMGSWGLYFGDTSTCTYATPADDQVCGAIVSEELDLSDADYAWLIFDYLLETESRKEKDIATVEFEKPGTGEWMVLAGNKASGHPGLIDDNTWHRAVLKISNPGSLVEFRFTFDSVDGTANDYHGFLVDNVRVKKLPDNAYFLGTARNITFEGSYGTDSKNKERPVSADPCVSSQNTDSCP